MSLNSWHDIIHLYKMLAVDYSIEWGPDWRVTRAVRPHHRTRSSGRDFHHLDPNCKLSHWRPAVSAGTSSGQQLPHREYHPLSLNARETGAGEWRMLVLKGSGVWCLGSPHQTGPGPAGKWNSEGKASVRVGGVKCEGRWPAVMSSHVVRSDVKWRHQISWEI